MAKKQQYVFDKVLRIGVSKEHNVINEQLLLPDRKFRIGDGNTEFVVDGFREHTLFKTQKGDYYLNFTPEMKGKIVESSSKKQMSLEALRDSSQLLSGGGVYSYRLEQSFRGKIQVGEYTFLFQFIDAPPLTQHQYYDKNTKVMEDDDLVFTILFSLSIFLAIILYSYSKMVELPEPDLEEQEEYIAKMLVEIQEVEPVQEEILEDLPTDDDGEQEADKEDKGGAEEEPEPTESKSKDDKKASSDEAPSQEQLDEAVAQLNNLKIIQRLGSLSEDAVVLPGGASFADGSSLDNLDSKLDGYKLVDGGAVSDAKLRGPQYGDARVDGNINVKKAGAGVKSAGVAKGPKIKVKGKVKSNKVKSKTGVCDKDFKTEVKKRSSHIRYCYDKELKKKKIEGKITISLRVKKGKVQKVTFPKNTLKSSSLESCIKKKVKKWRLPPTCNDKLSTSFVLTAK
ncbi:MAG: AgmX/PglI C-terminal domain-containing protein [Myxococcota bacterium]|nr:AgmX/PglI C-terminal domain-containing protein [Myxococcota bacterium]